jgi:hypothetical protein
MPGATISICDTCGDTFTINLDEMVIIPGTHPMVRKQNQESKPIRSWADWVEHISTHCPTCRYPAPPIQALEDLERLQEKNDE